MILCIYAVIYYLILYLFLMGINLLRPNQSTNVFLSHVSHALRGCMYQYALDIPHLAMLINDQKFLLPETRPFYIITAKNVINILEINTLNCNIKNHLFPLRQNNIWVIFWECGM